jgi:MFS family permease
MILSYIYNNRFDEALEFSKSRLMMFNNYYSMDSHGFLLLQMKQYKGAIYYFNKAMALVFGNRLLAVPLVFALVDRFTVGFFITAFPLYVQNVLGRTPAATGMLLSFFLLPFALLCYPMGRLADRGSRTLLIGGGSILYGACVVLVGEVGEDLLPVLMVALGVTSSVMFVPTLMLTGELAGPEHKATAMGGFNTAGSLGFLVGAIVAGEIIERVSASPAAADGYTAAFWCAGFAEIACVLLTLPALLRIDRQRRE